MLIFITKRSFSDANYDDPQFTVALPHEYDFLYQECDIMADCLLGPFKEWASNYNGIVSTTSTTAPEYFKCSGNVNHFIMCIIDKKNHDCIIGTHDDQVAVSECDM